MVNTARHSTPSTCHRRSSSARVDVAVMRLQPRLPQKVVAGRRVSARPAVITADIGQPEGTSMQLTDATVIVTGASRGFGRAIARSFHDHGATVVGVATSASRLAVLGDELGPRFVPITADVADPML